MAFVTTPGYTWINGEVVTATKLNLAATPTIASDQTYTFNNGAVATPSINFTGSTTTGLFYSATGIGLSVAATQYGFLDSAGLHLGNTFATNITAAVINAFNTNASTAIAIGQDATHNLNLLWNYNATAGSATATISTNSNTNDLNISSKNVYITTPGLNLALQVLNSGGRVIAGGQADDGVNALQAQGGLSYDRATILGATAVSYSATTNLNFTSGNDLKTLSITGNVTFTTSNSAVGRSLTLKILCDGTQRNLTFPGTWVWMGTAPTNIAINKTAILSLTCFGTGDANVVAAYAVQT